MNKKVIFFLSCMILLNGFICSKIKQLEVISINYNFSGDFTKNNTILSNVIVNFYNRNMKILLLGRFPYLDPLNESEDAGEIVNEQSFIGRGIKFYKIPQKNKERIKKNIWEKYTITIGYRTDIYNEKISDQRQL